MKKIIQFFRALYRTFLFWLKSKPAQAKETERLIKQLSPPTKSFYKPWFLKYRSVNKSYKKAPSIE